MDLHDDALCRTHSFLEFAVLAAAFLALASILSKPIFGWPAEWCA